VIGRCLPLCGLSPSSGQGVKGRAAKYLYIAASVRFTIFDDAEANR
jgi:hypothetical protein